ncbi:MAG: DUF1003 domain-containing protein [Candidatus Paceibacterota bacterium]|jgi:uncharacterized membrane protein
MENKKVIPLEELKKLKKPVNANLKHKESLTGLDKVAVYITSLVGTMWCAIAFTLLALVSLPDAIRGGRATMIAWIAQTFLQLVLLSVIMVGQNLQNKHSKARADANFDVNVKAELEVETILQHLENQNEKLEEISAKLEKK